MVTFGYMCFMIFLKWSINWEERGSATVPGTSMAPSIIGMLINMPLKLGSTDGKPLYDVETEESI